MPRLLGYARVSTAEQSLSPQIDELRAAGAVDVITDVASGARSARPGLDKLLEEQLVESDTLLVVRLDRLGRSLPHLVSVVSDLSERGIKFRSLSDGVIDTTSASGELVFHIFAALAQFERQLIRERTRAGLDAARARGRTGGRKRLTADEPRVVMAKQMHQEGTLSIDQICTTLKISRPTFYRYLRR